MREVCRICRIPILRVKNLTLLSCIYSVDIPSQLSIERLQTVGKTKCKFLARRNVIHAQQQNNNNSKLAADDVGSLLHCLLQICPKNRAPLKTSDHGLLDIDMQLGTDTSTNNASRSKQSRGTRPHQQ